MRKIFTNSALTHLKITGDDHKHVALVLRAKVGESLIVCTGDGYDYTYKIESISKNETALLQIDKTPNITEPTINITLFTAILKGDKNEDVVRGCTELGVKTFVPFTSEFVSAHSYKQDRMQKIALEAAKQSGRGMVPSIKNTLDFNAMCGIVKDFDLILFFYEGEPATSIKSFLKDKFKDSANKNIKNIAVIIGSEGGFSKKEVLALQDAGATPITMGKRILRSATAAVTACALVLYEAGQML